MFRHLVSFIAFLVVSVPGIANSITVDGLLTADFIDTHFSFDLDPEGGVVYDRLTNGDASLWFNAGFIYPNTTNDVVVWVYAFGLSMWWEMGVGWKPWDLGGSDGYSTGSRDYPPNGTEKDPPYTDADYDYIPPQLYRLDVTWLRNENGGFTGHGTFKMHTVPDDSFPLIGMLAVLLLLHLAGNRHRGGITNPAKKSDC